jgi:hypothetical protein
MYKTFREILKRILPLLAIFYFKLHFRETYRPELVLKMGYAKIKVKFFTSGLPNMPKFKKRQCYIIFFRFGGIRTLHVKGFDCFRYLAFL